MACRVRPRSLLHGDHGEAVIRHDPVPGATAFAASLLDAGADVLLDKVVFRRLSLDDETVQRSPPGDLVEIDDGDDSDDTAFPDLSVVVGRSGP